MRRILFAALIFVAFLNCGLAQQENPNRNDEKAHNPSAEQQIEGPKPSSGVSENGHANSKEKDSPKPEVCHYAGPFRGAYCFFALHDKFWVSFGTLVLAIGTSILGFATVFLWLATRQLVRDAREASGKQLKAFTDEASLQMTNWLESHGVAKRNADAANKAAEAAMLQAKTSADIERARLVTEDFRLVAVDGLEAVSMGLPEHPKIYLAFRNYGRSPAELLRYQITVHVGAKMPEMPAPTRDYPVAPGTMITERSAQGFWYIFQWPERGIMDVVNGNSALWVYGFAEYSDFIGKRHKIGFCVRGMPHQTDIMRFVHDASIPAGYIYREAED